MILFILIAILELLLSLVYIALNWHVAYDSDFFIDGIICYFYITLHLIYCFAKIFVPLMWTASGLKERFEIRGRAFVVLQFSWVLFAIVILILFVTIFGFACCLPVVIPNLLFLLYTFLNKCLRKDKKFLFLIQLLLCIPLSYAASSNLDVGYVTFTINHVNNNAYIPCTSHFHYYCRDHLGDNCVVVGEEGGITKAKAEMAKKKLEKSDD